MPIPDDKERFTFVLDKSLKHKLQVLADSENRKLGNYIANILEQHIIEFEKDILEIYGEDNFLENYKTIFGDNNPHLLKHGFYFPTTLPILNDNNEVSIKDVIRKRSSIRVKLKPEYEYLKDNLEKSRKKDSED
jgi:hypothetical protein